VEESQPSALWTYGTPKTQGFLSLPFDSQFVTSPIWEGDWERFTDLL
jgi:hypothetical protein